MALAAVPRDAVAGLGGDRGGSSSSRRTSRPGRDDVGVRTPGEHAASAPAPSTSSRSPRPAAASASRGDSAPSARATALAPRDRHEERHERVAPGQRAVEVEGGDAFARVHQTGRRRNTAVGRCRSTDHHVAQRGRHPHDVAPARDAAHDRVGDRVGRRPTAARPSCPRSSSCARTRAARSSRARRSTRATRRGPGSSRRCRPSTSRTRSSSAAPARRRPTTAARACRGPARAAARRAGTVTETVPVKFVCTISSAAAGSCSARAWSPSTPNATSTRSKSPKRSNVAATNASCDAKSVASNATASTCGRARGAQLGRRPRRTPRACGPRARRARRAGPTSLRTVASAMSEVPPSTSTDCTSPERVLHEVLLPAPLRSSRRSMSLRSRLSGRARRARRATRRAAGTSPRAARAAAASPW